MSQIEEDGYYVVKRLLTAEEVDACKKEIKEIVYKWYENFERTGVEGNDWEEPVNLMPAIKEGKRPMPEDKELSVRRLFRMAVTNEFFNKLCRHPKVCIPETNVRMRSLH